MALEHFLIVEDWPPAARAVARHLGGATRRTAIAKTVDEARQVHESLQWLTGAVVDLALPDGNGFEVVQDLRARDPRLPVLVITGTVAPSIANRCQLLGCELVFKPTSFANVRAFADRASWARRLSSNELARFVNEFSATHDLTRRERDVLGLALEGLKRPETAERLGVSENTVKMQIRSMLKKTGHANLTVLMLDLVRSAWLAQQ